MQLEEIGQSIRFNVKNIAYSRFSALSEYHNVISPFSRMYFITEGEGYILVKNEKIKLEQKQIIDEIGIKSVAYLCRVFKKYTSFTPEEYRNQRAQSI
jgi:AraC-like DNA-binding protein